MSNPFRGAFVAVILALAAGLAVAPAQQAPDELLTNAGWECVEGARVVDGKVVMTAGATSLGTLNDYAVRLETRPDVTISLTVEATVEAGFAGLNFWNSQPKPGDATSWYQTAAKVVVGLSGGRVFMRVFDGTGPTPAFQYSGRETGVTGPIALSVARESDTLVLRVAAATSASG